MKAEASIYIDRTPEEVFGFFNNRKNDRRWMASVLESEWLDPAAPTGLGRSGRMVMNVMGRREFIDEVTEYEPGRLVGHRSASGEMVIHTSCMAEPEGRGCRATVTCELESLPGGLFGRMAAPVTSRIACRNFCADLVKLKDILEAEVAMKRPQNVEQGRRTPSGSSEYVETLIIGSGQAGLSVGYHLARLGRPFVIVDANERIGDSWRKRWDSLRLFTPARFDGLDGMPFPAPAHTFPTKDEMADYLEAYAAHFELPVRTGVRVDRLARQGDRFVATAGDRQFEADQVVVAMANYQKPRVPPFARELDPGIVQLHSSEYRNPSQFQPGDVLIVGAGNSGSEIALEAAREHRTWMSGRDTGHLPFRIEGVAARLLLIRLVLRFFFHRVLTVNTPVGRKLRPTIISRGGPLIRVKPKDLTAAGAVRVPRVVGVRHGLPVLEGDRVLDVANVVWCTGFHPGFSWIDLPVIGAHEPLHERGVVAGEPGLYFVGLHFQYSLSSTMIHGVGRDAAYVAKAIAARVAKEHTLSPRPVSSRALTH